MGEALAYPGQKVFSRLQEFLVLGFAVALPLSMTVSWIVLIIGVILGLIELLIAGAKNQKLSVLPPAQISLPLLLFLLVVMISGFASGITYSSHDASLVSRLGQGLRESFISLWTFKVLLVYPWAHFVFMRNKSALRLVLSCLLPLAAVAGYWACIQQLTGFHPFGYQYLQGTGFLGGPMAFAGQMQIFAFLGLGLLITKGYQRLLPGINSGIGFFLITAGNFLGLFFAAERSAWLGCILGLLITGAILSWRVFAGLCAGLGVCGLLGWFFVPVVQKRLMPLFDLSKDISVQVRLYLWQEALKIWKLSPLLGIGICKFPKYDIPYAVVPGRSSFLDHAHSNYLHILATLGILGLGTFLWLWFGVLRASLTCYRRLSQTSLEMAQIALGERMLLSGLGLGIFAGTAALLVAGLFEYNFGTSQVRMAQWFVLAMLGPCLQTLVLIQAKD
jgi:O-antigen ligase